MFITIAVIAYNEENTIKNILDDISRQDYDHNLMEVVLVDSASTDGTKAVMQKFADEHFGELGGIAQQYLFYYYRSMQ